MKFAKLITLLCGALILAACDSDNNRNNIDEEFFALQVLHASPDAPPVNVFVDGVEVLSNVDYKQGSAKLGLSVRDLPYRIRVDAITSGGDVTVIGPAELNFEADTVYTIAAVGGVASGTLAPAVISQPDTAVGAGAARLFVLHGAEAAPTVDVFVTAPGADLTAEAPVGTFAFGETIGPAEVPAGDYQVRVTPAGVPGTVVYDSGTVTLGDGNDFVVTAVPNTAATATSSPISLVLSTGSGTAELRDVNAPTGLRIGHLSPDTPEVDVVVNGGVYLADVPYPAVTDFAPLPADTYNVAVQAAGNPGVVPIGPVDLTLEAGTFYKVLAVNFFSSIEAWILTDDPRPIATDAKVRILHASPTAQDVDIYLTAPGAGIADADPTLAGVPFQANTGYLALPAGDYDVTVTLPGTKDVAIGPATISIENGGVYTAIARDPLPGETEFGLIVLNDGFPVEE
jgi:hypothetical protein